jgi:hypothetical protein
MIVAAFPPGVGGARDVRVRMQQARLMCEIKINSRLRHQAGDEGNVARKPIQFRNEDAAQDAALRLFGRCQLWPPIERLRLCRFRFRLYERTL